MSTEALQESMAAERKLTRSVITILLISMFTIVLIVGVGVSIVVYNSVNNAPKIECIYQITKLTANDLHKIQHEDRNPKDYPEAPCQK